MKISFWIEFSVGWMLLCVYVCVCSYGRECVDEGTRYSYFPQIQIYFIAALTSISAKTDVCSVTTSKGVALKWTPTAVLPKPFFQTMAHFAANYFPMQPNHKNENKCLQNTSLNVVCGVLYCVSIHCPLNRW